MKYDNLTSALNNFGNKVVADAKANLNNKNSNDTGALNNSLQSTGVVWHKNSLELGINLNEYGAFIDKGVRGVGGVRKTTSSFKRTNNKGKMWKQNGGKSPYSFKVGVKPSVKHFQGWADRKGLNAFAVREAVYHQGIKPTNFLTDAVETNIPLLPNQVADAFALDVQSTVDFIFKSNFKK